MTDLSTKEKLLQVGKTAFLEKGYHHTGLQEIVRAAGVPKGSFYHFFPSKEEFGIEVLESHMQSFQPFIEKYLLDKSGRPAIQRLREFFKAGYAHLEKEGWRGGCIVGNLSQELADQSEVFRSCVGDALNVWQGLFMDCLREAQREGDLNLDENIEALGQFMMNGWEGAILRMKVEKSGEPLRNFIDVLFGKILTR